MSRAKLPLPANLKDPIELFERAITFPSDDDLYFKIERLDEKTKFALARWCQKEDGFSLLHLVVSKWTDNIRSRLLDILLNKGGSENVDVYHNFMPSCYFTPLTYVALLLPNDKNLFRRLLDISHHPADILRDALDQENASALVESFLADYPQIKHSVNSPSLKHRPAPLLKAARKRNLNAFSHLIRTRNKGGNAYPTILTVEGNNILHEMVLGIAENNPEGTSKLYDDDQAFFNSLKPLKDFPRLIFQKNFEGKSPISLACDLKHNELIASFIHLDGFLESFKANSDKWIKDVSNKILTIQNTELKAQLTSNLEQFAQDLEKINLDKTKDSTENLIESVKKASKIHDLLFELETLTSSLLKAKTADDFNKAKNTFVQNCDGKLYSEKVQDRYNALVATLVGLVVAAIIATTLLLFAPGGIATFGAASIISFVTQNIAISLAGGAAAAFIVGSFGYCGYNYSDASTWRADFFAVAPAVDAHVENSFAPAPDDDSVPLISRK